MSSLRDGKLLGVMLKNKVFSFSELNPVREIERVSNIGISVSSSGKNSIGFDFIERTCNRKSNRISRGIVVMQLSSRCKRSNRTK